MGGMSIDEMKRRIAAAEGRTASIDPLADTRHAGSHGSHSASRAGHGPARRPKSVARAYLMWALASGFGLHRFYLGRNGTGMAFIALSTGPLLLMIGTMMNALAQGKEQLASGDVAVAGTAFMAWIGALLILGVWWVIDGFRLAGMVRDYNDGID